MPALAQCAAMPLPMTPAPNTAAFLMRWLMAGVYNTELKTFPGVLWAATFFRSNKPMAEFTANESSQTPPVVKF